MKFIELSKPIVTCQDTLGESPTWDHRRNFLFWLDIQNGLIHSYEPVNKNVETYLVGEKKLAASQCMKAVGLSWQLRQGYVFGTPKLA